MRARFGVVTAAALVLASCGGNSVTASATVLRIDRTCTFIAKDDAKTRTEEDCNATPEFRAIADKGAPGRKRVVGTEIMHVSYPSPIDGSTLFGELHLTGRDDEFYTVNAGDPIAIRIKVDDPTRIRRA